MLKIVISSFRMVIVISILSVTFFLGQMLFFYKELYSEPHVKNEEIPHAMFFNGLDKPDKSWMHLSGFTDYSGEGNGMVDESLNYYNDRHTDIFLGGRLPPLLFNMIRIKKGNPGIPFISNREKTLAAINSKQWFKFRKQHTFDKAIAAINENNLQNIETIPLMDPNPFRNDNVNIRVFRGEANFESTTPTPPDWELLHEQALAARSWQAGTSIFNDGTPSGDSFVSTAFIAHACDSVNDPSENCLFASVRVSTNMEFSWDFTSVSASPEGAAATVLILVNLGLVARPSDNLPELVTIKFITNMSLSMPFGQSEGAIVNLIKKESGTEGTIMKNLGTGEECTTEVFEEASGVTCNIGNITFQADSTTLPSVGMLSLEPVSGVEFVPPPTIGSNFDPLINASITSRDVGVSAQALVFNLLDKLDPIPELMSEEDITTDENKLATMGRAVDGIAADGVAKLVLRLNSSGPGQAVFTLLNEGKDTSSSIDEDGSIQGLPLVGNPSSLIPTQEVQVDTVETTPGNHKTFVVYNSPMQFVRSNSDPDLSSADREVFMRVRFIPSDPGSSEQEIRDPIKIVRPPLFMVHGLWSKPNVWDTMSLSLAMNDRFFVCEAADYKETNAAFILKAPDDGGQSTIDRVFDQLKACIQQQKEIKDIATVQADVIAHSMGGLVSRALPVFKTTQYFRNDNFNKGDIHKLITIDTPHQGSRLATKIESVLDSVVNSNDLQALDRFVKVETILAIAAMADAPFTSGAIFDLNASSTRSMFLSELNKKINNIPQHNIVGIANPKDDIDNNKVFESLLSWLFTGNPIGIGFNDIFLGDNHDLIVEEKSQSAFSSTSSRTIIANVIHTGAGLKGTPVLNSPETSNKVTILMNIPTNSTTFKPRGFNAQVQATLPVPIFAFQQTARNLEQQQSLGDIKITSPLPDTTINTGDTFDVTVEPEGDNLVDFVFLSTLGNLEFDDTPPFEVTLTAPSDFIGTMVVMAVGGNQQGDVFSDEVSINVGTLATLQSLSATPSSITFSNSGLERQLRIAGVFDDGVIRDVTTASETIYSSDDTDIATVDSSGNVRSISAGSTTITISNAEVLTTIGVTVESSNHLPIAETGPDQTVNFGQVVQLDGSQSSDPDNGTLSFLWTVVSAPSRSNVDTNSFSDSTDVSPTFTPDVSGTYLIILDVTDDKGGISSDTTIVNVISSTDMTPTPTPAATPKATQTPTPPVKQFTFKCEDNFIGMPGKFEKLVLKLDENEHCTLRLTDLEPGTLVEVSTNQRTGLRQCIEVDPIRQVTDVNGEIEFTISAINRGIDWIAWAVPKENGKFIFNKKAYDTGLAWGMFVEVR